MIGLSLASAGSGLLLIADNIVRRAGAGEAGSLVGSALGVLRTQAVGPVFSSMVAQLARPEGLAALAGLALAAVVALMLHENVGRTAWRGGDTPMFAREALVPVLT